MKFDQIGLAFDAQLAGQSYMDVRIDDTVFPGAGEYGSVDTLFGKMTLVWCAAGLMYLGFREERSLEKIRHFFPDLVLRENPKEAARLAKRVDDIWRGRSKDKLTLVVTGTEFQKDVWHALLKIPCGHVVSYGAIASALGRDRAVRAVGSAVGANPISLLIPCHRVIQKNGSVCNYGWGDAVKQKLLKMEVDVALAGVA
ncbi:MAG: methylated-DNA--[protein]-cysteine S-methyltransferase [Pseudobdellovibrionaceae bacterium]|jgi:O-6-methylguanine DNA methyltransferase|nr:methylated-DNA--[protein]-cysteine S-methyltransferase [Pseudobdellovibrionaceae bacterium]